jgi:hypothetical protein
VKAQVQFGKFSNIASLVVPVDPLSPKVICRQHHLGMFAESL